MLATAFRHLIDADGLVRDSAVRRMDAVLALALSLAAVSLVLVTPLSIATLSIVLLGAGWLTFTAVAFQEGYWLSPSSRIEGLPIASAAHAERF